MLGLCIVSPPFSWADDDKLTAATRSACKDGNSVACFKMGERYRIIERDNKTAIGFYKKACEKDYMTGCTNGGILLFMSGAHGSSQWKNAKKMFQKACDAEEDTSCYNLGTMNFKEGRQKKALKLYQQACKMGNQNACAREKRLSR